MKKLDRKELKNIKGGRAIEEIDDGASCCCGVADCPDKEGWSKTCNMTCSTNANMGRCRYGRVIVE